MSRVEVPEFEESSSVVDSESSDSNFDSNSLVELTGGMVS